MTQSQFSQRRLFLKRTVLAGAGVAVSTLAIGQMGQHGSMMGHGQGMSNNRPERYMMGAGGLLAVEAMPTGQGLNSLWRLPNTSQEAGVFRATLIAKPIEVELVPGVKTEVWAYQGKVPGPLIELVEGETMEIEFENQLPQPTTIHWHGMTVPADQDGGPMDLVMPGHKRIYRFTAKPGTAGTYWFHSHPHHMTAKQVFKGLAGAVIVRAKDDPLRDLPEQHLIFSDLKLDREGQVMDNDMMDWMNGREGQFALVNGQREPVIEVSELQRWRLWNMNSARYLCLSLAGVPFTVVGTDGGLLAKLEKMTEILLTPGERVEIVIDPAVLTQYGQSFELVSEVYDRGKMMGASVTPRTVLAHVHVGSASTQAYAMPAQLRPIEPLGEEVHTRRIELQEVMDMQRMHASMGGSGKPQGMDFMMNGQLFDPERVDEQMNRGEVEIWEFYNNTDMDHPMHIHGTQFQVLDRQMSGEGRIEEPFLAWKDTVNVRSQEIVRVKMVQETAGDWMYHCHILEHEDLGMMGTLRVVRRFSEVHSKKRGIIAPFC